VASSAGPEASLGVVSAPEAPTLQDRLYPALEETLREVRGLALPGSGVPAAGCGRRIPKHCKGHDGAFWGRSHCNERSCPRCYERWASLEARTASLRVSWGAKYWQTRRACVLSRKTGPSPLDPIWLSKRLLIGHFVVSMPSDFGLWIRHWSPEKARALAYQIAQKHHVCGGAVVFHPWRRDDDLKEYVPDGYWHFHIIGIHFMPTTPGGSDVGPDGSMIVFKHIKDDEYQNYGGMRSQRGMSRLIQYQLTHAGLREGSHALTYFGLLAYNRLPAEMIHSAYPKALEDDSKTNPKVPATCPVCGPSDVEPCTYVAFAGREGLVNIQVHPEPEYEPTPELLNEAEKNLEEKFQNLYDTEPVPAARHALTKERQRERAKLAQRELELCNLKNPLVAMWVWLTGILENGSVLREDLKSETPELLARVVERNLMTGRLASTLGGRLYLKHEYDLDDALRDLKDIVQHGEPKAGRDWRLERLLEKNPDKVNPIMTDHGFVFDEVPWPEHIPKTVEKVPASCCVCGAPVGEFVLDQDDDGNMGLSLPNVWCDECKQKSLLERGLVEAPPTGPGVLCVDSEDPADRWRPSSPFSGGLE